MAHEEKKCWKTKEEMTWPKEMEYTMIWLWWFQLSTKAETYTDLLMPSEA